MCVCVCVCVVIPFILDVRLFMDAPAGVTQEVSQDFSTFLLRFLPYFVSREGFSRPFASSTVKSNFVYPRINRSILIYFLWGNIPVRVTAPRFEITSQRQIVSRLPAEPPRRPVNCLIVAHKGSILFSARFSYSCTNIFGLLYSTSNASETFFIKYVHYIPMMGVKKERRSKTAS